MKRIRTKLIFSLLIVTLLPIYPVYYLVKNLLRQSIEIGYNENVEAALESASSISKELYVVYKKNTLTLCAEIAKAQKGSELILSSAVQSRLEEISGYAIYRYSASGKILRTIFSDSSGSFPPLYQNMIKPALKDNRTKILEGIADSRFIAAFAPAQRNGGVVLMREVPKQFTQNAEPILNVLQMFKTLDFFAIDSGFVLSFFVIYAPFALLSVLIGVYLSRRITTPLDELVRSTSIVAAGDWEHRIEIKTRDEIGELVNSFNEMLQSLKQQQQQVVSLEKMAAWREMARILAHEIKNPLTPIQLTVQQIKDQYKGDDPDYKNLVDECSDIINSEIETLRKMAREFSDFARMPALNLITGNFNDLVRETVKIYPGNNIKTGLDAALPDAQFDSEKMRRVLINLIENSIDSIREKGAGGIQLKTSLVEGRLILEYSDTGNGIPEEIQDKIFEPYFSTKSSGMGLGMAIVKKIIEEHGGAIALKSEPGEYAIFKIEFPLEEVAING